MMIKTMDRHWTASNIAHEAKLYQERLGEESEVILVTRQNAKLTEKPKRHNPGRKPPANQNKSEDEPKPSETVCRNFLRGSCRFSPCKFKHMKLQTAILAISTNGTAMVKNSSVKSADF